jgi:hypothetical protein
MPVKGERLSNRQIATLKHLAICCSNGGQITLTRDQREATALRIAASRRAVVPLWRRELIEIWNRKVPGESPRGPFFRPSESGWRLIQSILEASERFAEAA